MSCALIAWSNDENILQFQWLSLLFDLYLTFKWVDWWILEAVIWTHLLNQPVVCAVERHIDTDDPEGFGAHPGDETLSLVLSTGLRRVIVAQHHLSASLGFLIVHPAVKGLGVFGVEHTLALQIKLHFFHWRDKTDRHVAHTCGVETEVDSHCSVTMVHCLAHDQQVQFDSFNVRVKVPPKECRGELRSSVDFGDRLKLYVWGSVWVWLSISSRYFHKSLLEEMTDGRFRVLTETIGQNFLWWRILVFPEQFSVATNEIAPMLTVNQLVMKTGKKWTQSNRI